MKVKNSLYTLSQPLYWNSDSEFCEELGVAFGKKIKTPQWNFSKNFLLPGLSTQAYSDSEPSDDGNLQVFDHFPAKSINRKVIWKENEIKVWFKLYDIPSLITCSAPIENHLPHSYYHK